MLLDERLVPSPADHAGIDAADAHAQFSAVAVVEVAALGGNKFRIVDFYVRVQVALGQWNRIEAAFGHAQMLCSQFPRAADGHVVAERSFAGGEENVGM